MEISSRSGFWARIGIILFVFVTGFLVSVESSRPKNVQVALKANWPGTPLLLEAGELLSKEWKDLYWEFIDVWHQNEDSDSHTAKDCLKKIIKHGKSLLGDDMASLFEFSLTLRSASPRLVLYRQLAMESISSFPSSDDVNSSNEETTEQFLKGTNLNIPKGKCCWVDTGGELFFDVAEFQSWLKRPNQKTMDSSEQPELYEFDHVHFDSEVGGSVAILYGALGTKCFREFHLALQAAAKEGKVKYVVRPILPTGCETEGGHCSIIGASDPVNLGGYGVELALENMEYKAMDDTAIKKGVTLEDPHTEDLSQDVRGFMFSKNLERKPELTSEIMASRDSLLSSTVSDTLDVWELKDLGLQTAQIIVHASDPLLSMQVINQNFPSVVSSLSRMKLNDSVKDEIVTNQLMSTPGKSLMALNGALLNITDINLYQLVDMVHQELSLADQYLKLKIPPSTVRKLLSPLPPIESSTFRVDFRSDEHVHYLNNLEEDARYKRWPSSISEISKFVSKSQLPGIRKNLFHSVFVLDPGSTCGLDSIDTMMSLYEYNISMRFSVILFSTKLVDAIEMNGGEISSDPEDKGSHVGEDISSSIIRFFLYIKEHHGNHLAFQFLSNVNKSRSESIDPEDAVEMHHVKGAFVETLLPKVKSPPQDTLLKFENEKLFLKQAQGSSMFAFKLGLAKLQCSALMNGLVGDVNKDAILNATNDELLRINEQVQHEQIKDHTNVLEEYISESGVPRYNLQIFAEGKAKPKYVSLSAAIIEKKSVLNHLNYLHSPKTIDDVKPVTHLLAIDVTSRKGIKLFREGIHYLIKGSKIARLGLLFNVNSSLDFGGFLFVKAAETATSSYSHKEKLLEFLDQLCSFYEGEMVTSAISAEKSRVYIDKICDLADSNGLPSKDIRVALSEFSIKELQGHLSKVGKFVYRQLGLEPGTNAVITNGRVIQVGDSTFLSDDLRLLESLEYKHRIKHIFEAIVKVNWENIDPDELTSEFISNVIMLVTSSISTRERSSKRILFESLSATYSAVILNNENSCIHIDAVIDPLSASGQKLSSILRSLWKSVQPSMRLVLIPNSSMVDLPLKNYYRYVIPTIDDFSSTDLTVHGPKAFFANMPLSKTLTLNLDVPEPWLVEPVIAIHELDNILLENLGDTRTLQAVFELEALVITGHCSEKDREPPRGLQLMLGSKNKPHLVDTIVMTKFTFQKKKKNVMAKLGYWQMKVSPGVWHLQLAPGRSSELYTFKDNLGSSGFSFSKRIIIDDLRGKLVHLEVVKKKRKEHEKLLVPSHDDNQSKDNMGDKNNRKYNILKWLSRLVGGSQSKKSENTSLEHGNGGRHGKTINIFSIASGHLYERFLKIMILSVLKNTQRPVKFWFIKNYLSPQFKDVIPHMAQEYGFEYELVTYKWPTWLHKQKEKQRIIWAYKILFLDVIFPISLEKVIFVDADQIVRADMGELYDMDIKGRPLAYTPFCDNNRDMDGYRFWRQGLWKDHLGGRPYHISALYVVDLVKFRETASGDNLREFYENLSEDPKILSNLDQDLPNYAQHTVPIFSLPQEWLWCESWCGNATKSKAKTIDLCNNPMTKEPKLLGARRIVSEWSDLDYEARSFTAIILGEDAEPKEQVPTPAQVEDTSSEDTESKAEL